MTNTNVLLLNASYEPLGVISWQEAVSKMIKGTAHSATDAIAKIVKTVSRDFTVPQVIVLKKYVNVPRLKAIFSNEGVKIRDGYRCGYCGIHKGETRKKGRAPMTKKDFNVDHIKPKSQGGLKRSWMNTICSCIPCNERKADRTPHQAGMALLWEPKTPRTSYIVASGDTPIAWKQYIEIGK